MPTFYITTFYVFFPIPNISETKTLLRSILRAPEISATGLVILANEGINATLAVDSAGKLKLLQDKVNSLFSNSIENFKNSLSSRPPFAKLAIKERPEIVTLGTPNLKPGTNEKNRHLSPSEWDKVLREEKDFVLIDTRNWYETKIGTFKGAVNPQTDTFAEFPEFMQKSQHAKNKKVLIFCTGGIRCEKGILALQEQGYNNVYQLQGGILNYLKEYPEGQFEGECFVFDKRVAVDRYLQPSQRYSLCPHCGQPADQAVNCKRCDSPTHLCEACQAKASVSSLCSKFCAYFWNLRPGTKGRPQMPQLGAMGPQST